MSKVRGFIESNKFVILSLAVLGLTVYANTFRNGMFWDDNDFILNNRYVADWQFFGRYFSENIIAGAGFQSNYWRPVLLFVFSLEHHLWQSTASLYHVFNAAVHILDGVLLYYLLFRIFQKRWLAFFAAAVFLVHPLQTEAVSYANSLGDSLSALFMFSGILLFLKGRRFWPLVFYALALMTKETAIVMPGFLAIAYFFESGRQERFAQRLWSTAKVLWPYLVLAGTYVLLRATSLNFGSTFNLYAEQNAFTSSIAVRVMTFFRILSIYFGLLFWPLGQHMERTVDVATSLVSPSVLFGGALFVGFLTLAVLSWRKWPVVSFGLLWFFTGLAPTSNIAVPINGLLYEHWLYLPMIGIFLVVIWFGMALSQRLHAHKVFAVIFVICLVFFGSLAIRRNTDWHDPIRFYNQVLHHNQSSYRIYNNLGMAYADAGDFGAAERNYLKAVELDPRIAVAYHNLGNAYRDSGQAERAKEYYEKALSADPDFYFSYNSLAGLHFDAKDYEKTRNVLERYLKAAGERVDLLVSLTQVAVLQNDFSSAAGYLERALRLSPDNRDLQNWYFELRSKSAK